MSSEEYWTEKTVSWNTVIAGFATGIFAVVILLLADTLIHVTTETEKFDDVSVQRDTSVVRDVLTGREYHLLNCRNCE